MTWRATTPRRAAPAAAAELRRDPYRSDAAIAWAADCGTTTVGHVRHDLETRGDIPAIPISERAARPRPPQPSRTRLAIEAGATSSRQVADLSGASMQAAWKARRLAERRLADAAETERAARSATGREPPIHEMPSDADVGFFALGLCLNVAEYDPEWWVSGKPADTERARRICRVCAVRIECAQWSVRAVLQADTAIYGGLSRMQRKDRRAERNR